MHLQVPFRRVALTNGTHFDLYDTSGPQVGDRAGTVQQRVTSRLHQSRVCSKSMYQGHQMHGKPEIACQRPFLFTALAPPASLPWLTFS